MTIIAWDFSTGQTRIEKQDDIQLDFDKIINENDSRVEIQRDALCTCEVQAVSDTLKAYRIKTKFGYATSRKGATLLNIPGTRIENEHAEAFIVHEDNGDLTEALLTQFLR